MSIIYKALICYGSRPELIKLSPLYHKLKTTKNILPILCNTGQHKDLLTPHMNSLNLKADVQLNVMRKGQSLDQLMMQLFAQLPEVFQKFRPDIVIVQGDTASALACAIIARKKQCPIAHIEAGLRTYDHKSPFPEEIYRQNISKLARWHFCPTQKAQQNLLSEGYEPEAIFVTGNTSVDMILDMQKKLANDREISVSCGPKETPKKKPKRQKPFFLITLHRRESQGTPLVTIINSLLEFANSRPEFDFIFPLHPNPASSDMIKALLGGADNIRLIAPLAYPRFVQLMSEAFAIITDSGGIQEEGPALNTPVIVIRNKTERAEGVENGCLRLAGTDRNSILSELNLLIDDKAHYKAMQEAPNPFGDGKASDQITSHLIDIIERDFPENVSPEIIPAE
ncbi:UDP-N-acetylglucosamine 2-epimerase [hydrothermal vent metagenome]|uniref:UDP-N-acetylglucosamine 2-epimerase (non-hydrolyzing) n=1 Tax=hydrothermal vent metagenome TaxID=652676 RepID=A0A3B1B435_9ZZZZ